MMIQVRPARFDSSYIIIITIIITKHIVHFLVSWYYTTLRTYLLRLFTSQSLQLPVYTLRSRLYHSCASDLPKIFRSVCVTTQDSYLTW